ncbi:hypothetical protein ASPWEDRAFT_164812 [Aspergillus wentii DTO 134E9]|uniref:Xylanolytic transcriptional activator regulatory domain-containing protein n=1 Tax=Aspergillus wentii DTO 134E9 TaxID=1073089 RepID=A0A1L9R6N6_ASPWE|nr:uncharacterized protein ASPWEDRAFT_164812 [Aspergillus wentii DTO 134E9]OJJ30547.1 hypothetical protein ASPWEDRAFT_164812 [Aspergillus wentii DTO 134E9]
MLLQNRIELLEKVLRLHSIDVNASIAQIRAGETSPVGGGPTASLASQQEQQQQPTELDGALCLEGTPDIDGDGEMRYFGSSSGRVELLQLNGDKPATPSSPSTRIRLNQLYQELDSAQATPAELEQHLVTLYYEWEQPWAQLVDESLFRHSQRTNGRYFSPLLLNCILAMGSRYSDRPEVRSSPDDPNTAGQTFLETAEVLLHFDLRSPSITTIQSLGIMAMIYVATGSDTKGWLRHGMAIRLALDMGFNLDSSILDQSCQLPDVEIKLRRQIYWALYCTDKLWASYTGRICTMLESQASVELPLSSPVDVDGAFESESGMLSMLHHALSTHCQILEKILTKLYAPKKLPPGAQKQTFLDSYLLELKSWKYNLPANLQIKHPGKSKVLAHIFILHMVYQTSIIILAKPFLPKRSPRLSTESQSLTEAPTEIKASALCMEAAKEICILAEQYRKAFGSFRRSPITATHCTLLAVLLLSGSCGSEHGNSSNARMKLIESCLITLNELSDSWTPARQYWRGVLCLVENRPQMSDPVVGTHVLEGPADTNEAQLDLWHSIMEADYPFDDLMIDLPHNLEFLL